MKFSHLKIGLTVKDLLPNSCQVCRSVRLLTTWQLVCLSASKEEGKEAGSQGWGKEERRKKWRKRKNRRGEGREDRSSLFITQSLKSITSTIFYSREASLCAAHTEGVRITGDNLRGCLTQCQSPALPESD